MCSRNFKNFKLHSFFNVICNFENLNISLTDNYNGLKVILPASPVINYTRNTCMQQPLALIGIQGTIFSEHEVFRVYDFEIVFIFTLSIFFKKCENNESIINFNYKIHNLHNFFS